MNVLRRLLIAVGLGKLVAPARAEGWVGTKVANDQVRDQLLKLGDDGTAIRNVRHFFYRGSADGAASVVDVTGYLAQLELAISDTEVAEGLIAEHTSEVASASFDALTLRFVNDTLGMGWQYDGWECAVVHPAA
ncbi:MAG: ribonuclease E inhibitor RraB [Cypionkella sp.]|uniref:ribonuclease E inhibitor RraB n=1 Tax=Cypionkella sp. TaxID=2811411 RepID=UPI002ABA0E5E|nr:ribonuclease E inhibitor RraB [Cypionkella sp.]MDZ4310656.1 ribonuclease E inhibitor RraB [Cypionkella sp.]MDZ4392735.1 ribonuclease E inhibitor RraB [Cypionkella sp.]